MQLPWDLRIFQKFLKRFELIEMEGKDLFFLDDLIIRKNELLDQLIKWKI